MKERNKLIFAMFICLFTVASIILSFFDSIFWGVTVFFGISLVMIIQHRTALIPQKRISLIINNFKSPFQAFGKLKEYHAWTWALSILFFVLGVLGMLILMLR